MKVKIPASLATVESVADITVQQLFHLEVPGQQIQFCIDPGSDGNVEPGVMLYLGHQLGLPEWADITHKGLGHDLMGRQSPAQVHVVKELLLMERLSCQGFDASKILSLAFSLRERCPEDILKEIVDSSIAAAPSKISIPRPQWLDATKTRLL